MDFDESEYIKIDFKIKKDRRVIKHGSLNLQNESFQNQMKFRIQKYRSIYEPKSSGKILNRENSIKKKFNANNRAQPRITVVRERHIVEGYTVYFMVMS